MTVAASAGMHQPEFMTQTDSPHLYVDLDGTLIASDLLHESALGLARQSPWAALMIPAWLLRGKAFVKRQIAQRVQVDAALLPYRRDVLQLIERAREEGRRVVLATASDEMLAGPVARHLGVFDHVLASDGVRNLSGQRKLEAIRADAGDNPFCYVGNDAADLPVWRGADSAVVVSSRKALRRQAGDATRVESAVDVPKARLRDYLYGLRLHQWLKNLLVFLPLLPILGEVTGPMALAACAMFVAFCLCASAIYVVNDLLDLEADRQHHRKKRRPFAAGVIPIWQGIVLAVGLLLLALMLAMLTLPLLGILALLGYVVLTSLYSTWLKQKMLVDVFALATLYTTRILAGSAATNVEPSFWLLGFSMFMFLSLALAKRYIEIRDLGPDGAKQVKGRGGYSAQDGVLVLAAGLAAGQLAVLTLSLFLNDPKVTDRYPHPYALWLLCPLMLYWLIRIWMKAHRREMHDDPVVFAATDRISQAIAVVCLALVVLASL
jgi:4-hydroxybenzoate polyprenyltransferase/phosphoserine phosphatase